MRRVLSAYRYHALHGPAAQASATGLAIGWPPGAHLVGDQSRECGVILARRAFGCPHYCLEARRGVG